jgi:hypothetical protein
MTQSETADASVKENVYRLVECPCRTMGQMMGAEDLSVRFGQAN